MIPKHSDIPPNEPNDLRWEYNWHSVNCLNVLCKFNLGRLGKYCWCMTIFCLNPKEKKKIRPDKMLYQLFPQQCQHRAKGWDVLRKNKLTKRKSIFKNANCLNILKKPLKENFIFSTVNLVIVEQNLDIWQNNKSFLLVKNFLFTFVNACQLDYVLHITEDNLFLFSLIDFFFNLLPTLLILIYQIFSHIRH